MTNGRRIRNGQLRRDFKRLLTIIAHAPELHKDANEEYQIFEEIERIAGSHALRFDDDGQVREVL